MRRIETHRPRVPWSWVTWMVLPWGALSYFGSCSAAPLAFTIRKLVESPTVVAFLSSINFAMIFTVSTIASYMSDRIWTRWGRRRPLLIVGWIGGAIATFFVPLADNIWELAVLIVIFQFCSDVGSPYEPLYNEVIPPAQRGRASTLRSILQNLVALFFNGVMLAQFDRKYDLGALERWVRLDGERLLYWTAALGVLASALFLWWGVRETPPPESIRVERFSFLRFCREVFGRREQWLVYLLYICPYLTLAGISSFTVLFQSEQLGFTRQQVGWAAGAVGILNMALFVPVAGYLADRLPRLKLLQFALVAPVAVNLTLFCTVRFATNYQLDYTTLLLFLLLSEGLMALVSVVWGPLVYDYLPSSSYGTAGAGFSFVGGLVQFLVLNGAGLWVQGFTQLFGRVGRSQYDYSSVFIWQALTAGAALLLARVFARAVSRGEIVAHARQEFAAGERVESGAGR